MPKGMGYGEAGKASKMMGKGKSAKAANKPLKETARTKKIRKQLKAAGLSDEEITKRLRRK